MEFFENLRKKFIRENVVNPLAQGDADAKIQELVEQGIFVTPNMRKLIKDASLRDQISKQEDVEGQGTQEG